LAERGKLIGAHDLIIAATAITHDLSLLTSNSDECSRVPGLKVIEFS
jgi:predicted nucleic acid-binding protein